MVLVFGTITILDVLLHVLRFFIGVLFLIKASFVLACDFLETGNLKKVLFSNMPSFTIRNK